MKKQSPDKKNTRLFLIVTSLLIVIFLGLTILNSIIDKKPQISPLPDTFDSNINELVINEVMTSNSGVFANDKNESTDFIELYNGTSKTINLNGYGLSDRKDRIKWVFSDVEIKPNGYIIVSLTGKLEDGLNASFKLSSKGKENIILTKPNGKVVDAVETVSLGKNQVMARDKDGVWIVSDIATPGQDNSLEGRQKYLDSIMMIDDNCPLVINELLPSNKGNFTNENGRQEGFIEFINIGNTSINLSDYTLSDTTEEPFKMVLPNVTLSPNQIYSLYLGKADYKKEAYLGFSVPNNSGNLLIGSKGKIVSEFEYSSIGGGLASVRSENGIYYNSSVVSPGYKNNPEGIKSFQEKYLRMPEGLVISELMSENTSYLSQNGDNHYDWIELYNNSNTEISLKDYYLSTDDKNLLMYNLPDITIKANGYYVLMCSGDSNLTNQSYYHTSFKIGEHESIYLSKNNQIVDSVFVSDIPVNMSYSRYGEYGFYYAAPTPNKNNNSGDIMISPPVIYSLDGGVFNNSDTLYLELKGTGKIYYTIDGSTPTSTSLIYKGPIALNKTTVVKAINIENGARMSSLEYNSYIINENHTLPVVSVTIDPQEFNILNTNPWENTGEQAYVEFYEDGGSFKLGCSITLNGGNARAYDKKAYALRFKSAYGPSSLNYPLFDTRDCSSYESIVLRSGSSDQFAAFIRDVFATSLVDEYTDLDVNAYKPSILYINGQYWGIYNIREKCSYHAIQDHYNVPTDGLNFANIDKETKYGSYQPYAEIRKFAVNNDLSKDENFDKLCEMIDMTNMIDYWIAESYCTNNDLYNVRFFSSPYINDGKLRYYYFDMDYALYWYANDYYTKYLTADSFPVGRENDIIKNCFKNKKFCQMWLERLNYNLHNTWSNKNTLNRFNELVELYKPEMPRNQKRWNLTMTDWNDGISYLKTFITNRNYYFLRQTKSFFNLTDIQMKEYFDDLW